MATTTDDLITLAKVAGGGVDEKEEKLAATTEQSASIDKAEKLVATLVEVQLNMEEQSDEATSLAPNEVELTERNSNEQELWEAVLQQKPLKTMDTLKTECGQVTDCKTAALETSENQVTEKIAARCLEAASIEFLNTVNELTTVASPTTIAIQKAAAAATTCNNVANSAAAKTMLTQLEFVAQQEQQCKNYELQLEQMSAALAQKDNMLALFQRENDILEKEKQAFRKEKEQANKEKESIVIKFAMKEKLLIDAKKEKDAVEKQLSDAKKEIKNVSTRFHALNEEKSRITYMMDEKCNEVRKYQRECEKLKTDNSHLESKLKYHINKLNMETEAKQSLEKKLEEERNAPNKLEEKANEKLKMEYDANHILLKHELTNKDKTIDTLTKEQTKNAEHLKQLQEQLNKDTNERNQLGADLDALRQEHEAVQNAYSDEMLNSAKLRGKLDELQLLKTQNTLNEEKISMLTQNTLEMEEKLQDNSQDLLQLHAREQELLSLNKEMSESIVGLQNEICLLKAKAQGIEAENALYKKEQLNYDTKYLELDAQLKQEQQQKAEERQLLTKHLSEKTKQYETIKMKLENVFGDLEATQNKHAQVVKELHREIQKYKKSIEQNVHTQQSWTAGNQANSPAKAFADAVRKTYCSQCQKVLNGNRAPSEHSETSLDETVVAERSTHSRQSSRRPSATSECETVASNASALTNDLQGPSKKHLVERILRLQQASARQTEKIDFLENHTLSLVAELQKKSKVVQYYMVRDQAGALTSGKSDQNKTELAKYGGGVMAAIYGGIKGGATHGSMTLDLSLEINKKLQAVLEDTLLKNITLKENLDVLGLEVDKLTRKLSHVQPRD